MIPRLPRAAIVVLVGDAISALGQGMSLPFLLVYLSQVRGINIAVAGLVLSTFALVSFIGNPVGGWLTDPLGPRRVLIFSQVCSAAGVAMFAWATHALMAFLAAALLGLYALVIAMGFAQYHAAFPGWAARDPGGIPTAALGACFAANAITVVVLQLPILRALAGLKRTTALALACAGWAFAWLLALIFGYTGNGWLARGGFIAAMVMFGIAETALSPTVPAIVNDLAPDHLRGRYNGVSALGMTTGFLIGPAIAGFALNAHAGAALLAGLMAACLLAAAWALHLGRRLPLSANQISATAQVDGS